MNNLLLKSYSIGLIILYSNTVIILFGQLYETLGSSKHSRVSRLAGHEKSAWPSLFRTQVLTYTFTSSL
jgi:hypothetical protein